MHLEPDIDEKHPKQPAPQPLRYASSSVDEHDQDPTGAKRLLRWLLTIVAVMLVVLLLWDFSRGLFIFVF